MRYHEQPIPTDEQRRQRRRLAEDRQNRTFSVPLPVGVTYAVLLVELADGATKEQVESAVKGLAIITEITDMAPLRAAADLEADETQTGRVVVDKVSRTIEPNPEA